MSLRKLSSRCEQGKAVHIVEANNDAATKLIPAKVQKTMLDAVLIEGKRYALFVRDFSKADTELDIRFATLHNSLATGEHWTFHRFICVPRDPEPNTDEWEMVKDFYTIMFREAGWCGIKAETFEGYLKGEGLV